MLPMLQNINGNCFCHMATSVSNDRQNVPSDLQWQWCEKKEKTHLKHGAWFEPITQNIMTNFTTGCGHAAARYSFRIICKGYRKTVVSVWLCETWSAGAVVLPRADADGMTSCLVLQECKTEIMYLRRPGFYAWWKFFLSNYFIVNHKTAPIYLYIYKKHTRFRQEW